MTATIFTIAFLLNWMWEVLQQSLYAAPPSFARRFRHCFWATVLDAGFIVGIYLVCRYIFRNPYWIFHMTAGASLAVILSGATVAAIGEVIAIRRGWWAYAPRMPRLPLIGVGLLPVLQLTFLPLLTFVLTSFIAN